MNDCHAREPFRIVIDAQGMTLAGPAREAVGARLRTELEPFAAGIVVVHARLWSAPGGEGPAICHVRVDLRPSGGIALGEIGADVPTAVARAGRRMADELETPVPGTRRAVHAWLR